VETARTSQMFAFPNVVDHSRWRIRSIRPSAHLGAAIRSRAGTPPIAHLVRRKRKHRESQAQFDRSGALCEDRICTSQSARVHDVLRGDTALRSISPERGTSRAFPRQPRHRKAGRRLPRKRCIQLRSARRRRDARRLCQFAAALRGRSRHRLGFFPRALGRALRRGAALDAFPDVARQPRNLAAAATGEDEVAPACLRGAHRRKPPELCCGHVGRDSAGHGADLTGG
jgi:hypothetical protein